MAEYWQEKHKGSGGGGGNSEMDFHFIQRCIHTHGEMKFKNSAVISSYYPKTRAGGEWYSPISGI